jgi:type IV pilus assembly protein PilA
MAIAVILATLAVREHAALKRRARNDQAVETIGELFNATAQYFHERRPSFSGDGIEAPHRCPHPLGAPAGGETGFTPALEVRCSDASGGACTLGGDDEPGAYDLTAWTLDPMWIQLGYVQTTPHFHHYNLVTANSNPDEHGVCRFSVIARGDDPSDPCNEFRRDGVATAEGVIAGPLQACPEALSR